MATYAVPASTEQITYEDLYARWEKGNWRATEIDFGQDVVDWREKLTDEQRRSALWLYSLFFHGEDSVADNLSPYIDAAPREEQKYFLATQQVDEARHSVFFKRFMHEVVGLGDGSVSGALDATQPELSWGWQKVFGRLDEMADELRKDHSSTKLAEAVTLYHIIVEASLAQPGQHMIEHYLGEYDLLPGFREGMRNVSQDEQRHIAFGVRLLSDLLAEHGEPVQDAIVDLLREVMPWTIAVPKPPGFDRSYTECFGFTLEEMAEAGAESLERKLRAVGLKLEEIPGLPISVELGPKEQALRGVKLLETNLVGPDRPVHRDPEAIRYFFEQLAYFADPRVMPAGTTIQWNFTDSEPWHLVIDNGRTRAVQGSVARPDIRFRCRLDDWADVAAERADPRRLMLTGKLRPRGKPWLLLRMSRLFGR